MVLLLDVSEVHEKNGFLKKSLIECEVSELLVKVDSLLLETELHDEIMMTLHHDDHESKVMLL
jgi:hypothetical protein